MRLLRDVTVAVVAGIVVAFLFRSAAFATYYIPSESMVPTLQVGDHLAVSKFAYGWGKYSFPTMPLEFTGRVLGSLPDSGDVVVFAHPADGRTMIKRVIGLPGDTVQMVRGRLVVNGKVAKREIETRYAFREYEGRVSTVTRYLETLPNGRRHVIIQESDRSPLATTGPFVVPAGMLFMMGDNRDNSADSRFDSMGFVPVENLIGRADTILYSTYTCEPERGLSCATARSLTSIQ